MSFVAARSVGEALPGTIFSAARLADRALPETMTTAAERKAGDPLVAAQTSAAARRAGDLTAGSLAVAVDGTQVAGPPGADTDRSLNGDSGWTKPVEGEAQASLSTYFLATSSRDRR